MITDYDYSKIDNYEELRKLQLTQLEILKYVDNFCQKNNLKYSIAYGSLLGAVRHGGFIPWDDDLDICMPRDDYNKFINLWQDNETYLIQNHIITPEFRQSFTKIRKNNTAFVQKTDLGKDYHKGIFIDIFPFDRVPEKKINRKIQMLNGMLYNLYTRGYSPKNGSFFIRLFSSVLLKLVSKDKYIAKSKKYLDKMCKYDNNSNLKFADMTVFSTMNKYFDSDIFQNSEKIIFEDSSFPVMKDYTKILRVNYGDYMKLPPEKDQTWYHHPILIDFDKNH